MKLKPIDQQVVVIVGATSGIGREAALQFGARGARVVAAGRSQEALDSLVEEVRGMGGEATAVRIDDVAQMPEMNRLAEMAERTYGSFDTWIHAAAVAVYAKAEETMPSEFQRVVEVNLLGSIYGSLAALPRLKESGGSLIMITSVEAQRSIPMHSAYAASKHGVKGFINALRMEVAEEGAPVNIVNVMPSSINTPFFAKSLTRMGVKPQPYPPVYEPEVAAKALLYAATHPSRDIFVGGGGGTFSLVGRISPRLADRFMRKTGFVAQRSDIPKSPNAPHNLYEHISGHDTAEGEFGAMAKPYSMWTWLRTHPFVRMGLTILAIGGGAYLFRRRRDIHPREALAHAAEWRAVQAAAGLPHKVAHSRVGQAAVMLPAKVAEMKVLDRAKHMQLPVIVQRRRRIGPVVLPGHIGPVKLRGRIGPVTVLPAHIGPLQLPEKIGPVTIPVAVGPYGLPRIFAAFQKGRKKDE